MADLTSQGGAELTAGPVGPANRARAHQAFAIQSDSRPRSQVLRQHSCIGHGVASENDGAWNITVWVLDGIKPEAPGEETSNSGVPRLRGAAARVEWIP